MQVKKIDKAEWQTYLDKCPAATFFHTPDWYEVWKKYAGYAYEARLLVFESGKKLLLPLCWRLRLKGLVKEYISSPVGTYGGFVTFDDLSDTEKKEASDYLKTFKLLEMRANPLCKVLDTSFFSKKDFTQLIPLNQGWPAIFKKWSKGHASAAKKGIRDGVKVSHAKKEEWLIYFQMYLDTFERWDNPPDTKYNWELFEIIRQVDADRCKLWLAKFNGEVTAGALCFYFQKHVVYWHGASLERYLSTKSGHVLQYFIIRDAIENGFDWYDFNPSGGHVGVEQFKKGFSPIEKTSDIYFRRTFLIKRLLEIGKKAAK